MGGAEREFEDHERALWEQLLRLMEERIPPGATVQEAIEAMQEAAFADPEVEELTYRVMSMAHMGGGAYIRAKLSEPPPPLGERQPEDEPGHEPRYRLTDQPTRPIVEEEIELLDRISKVIDERLPADLTDSERHSRAQELIDNDPELDALAERLQKLAASHDQSVMLTLAKLTEEEEREREEADEE